MAEIQPSNPDTVRFSRELPTWTIVVFVLSLIFAGGKLYAETEDTKVGLKELTAEQKREIAEVERQLVVLRAGQSAALADLKVFGNQLDNIERLVEKLDRRTEARYKKD